MGKCKKCKYRRITDFPDQYVDLLMKIETKREVIGTLMGFMEMHRVKKEKDPNYIPTNNWILDIERIGSEFGGMLSLLPKEIRDQYEVFIEIRELYSLASRYLMDGDHKKANETWAEARSKMCCGREECDG